MADGETNNFTLLLTGFRNGTVTIVPKDPKETTTNMASGNSIAFSDVDLNPETGLLSFTQNEPLVYTQPGTINLQTLMGLPVSIGFEDYGRTTSNVNMPIRASAPLDIPMMKKFYEDREAIRRGLEEWLAQEKSRKAAEIRATLTKKTESEQKQEERISADSTPFYNFDPARRNEFLPFHKGAEPWNFTFKNGVENSHQLGIFPDSFNKYNKDVSFREILGYDDTKNETIGNKENNFWTVINNLPTILIREIALNSRVMEIANAFSAFGLGMDTIKKALDNKNTLHNITMLFIAFFKKIFSTENGIFTGNVGLDIDCKDETTNLLNIPYRLYYMLIAGKTMNRYELPCDLRSNPETVASVGWKTGDDFGLVGDIGTGSILGKLLKFVGGLFAVAVLPRWDPKDTAPQTATVTVLLFNDTALHALLNFLFIHSIVPGAMTMLYSIVKHAPHVYDVKVSGYTRMFMCACDITVNMKGNIRKPSNELIKQIKRYVNDKYKELTAYDMKYDLIRIPDVYEVLLNFTSLLPHNFNNYMYVFGSNNGDLAIENKTGTQDLWLELGCSFQDAMDAAMNIANDKYIGDGKARTSETCNEVSQEMADKFLTQKLKAAIVEAKAKEEAKAEMTKQLENALNNDPGAPGGIIALNLNSLQECDLEAFNDAITPEFIADAKDNKGIEITKNGNTYDIKYNNTHMYNN